MESLPNLSPVPGVPSRLHWLDALRSMLMLLGVVLHSAYPYAAGVHWLVADPHRISFFDWLTDSIHLFRMPAFFLVSGFFSMLLLRKRSRQEFMRERMRRIGVPFLSTLLTLNLLQIEWLARNNGISAGTVLSAAWHDGHWTGHLWFLAYLLGFCVMAALLATPLRRISFAGRIPPRLRIAGLVAMGIAAYGLPRLLWHVWPQLTDLLLLGCIDPVEWLEYLPFFMAGLLLQGDEEGMAEFSTCRLGSCLLAITAAGVLYYAENRYHLPAALAYAVLVWVSVRLSLAVCRRYLDRASDIWRYLSDASYTVYLFHHLVVVVAATLLTPLGWSAAAKFAAVLCLATGLPLAVHHFLVLRLPWLRYLFNGKRTREAGARPRDAALRTSSAPRSP